MRVEVPKSVILDCELQHPSWAVLDYLKEQGMQIATKTPAYTRRLLPLDERELVFEGTLHRDIDSRTGNYIYDLTI